MFQPSPPTCRNYKVCATKPVLQTAGDTTQGFLHPTLSSDLRGQFCAEPHGSLHPGAHSLALPGAPRPIPRAQQERWLLFPSANVISCPKPYWVSSGVGEAWGFLSPTSMTRCLAVGCRECQCLQKRSCSTGTLSLSNTTITTLCKYSQSCHPDLETQAPGSLPEHGPAAPTYAPLLLPPSIDSDILPKLSHIP